MPAGGQDEIQMGTSQSSRSNNINFIDQQDENHGERMVKD